MKRFLLVLLALILLTTTPGWTQEEDAATQQRHEELEAAVKASIQESARLAQKAADARLAQMKQRMAEHHRRDESPMPEGFQRLQERIQRSEAERQAAARQPRHHTVTHTFPNGHGGLRSVRTTCVFYASETICTTE